MKREREKVITILRFYRDVDKTIKLNERVIKNLEDQYYTTLGPSIWTVCHTGKARRQARLNGLF